MKVHVETGRSKEVTQDVIDDIAVAFATVTEGTGAGSAYLGWRDLPDTYDKAEYARIQKAAHYIRSNAEIFIIIGIGGSYLGSRAVIDSLSHPFYNAVDAARRQGPQIFYAGNHIDGAYLRELCDMIRDKSVCINVISKSGTTTEPAVAFRVLKKAMRDKYDAQELAQRIFVTTDAHKGALKTLATEEGFETFVVPDDVGGRYSVLTAVGLLPIAVAGIDTDELLRGAADMVTHTYDDQHPSVRYAQARTALYRSGKKIEIMVGYDPTTHYFSEWWKQLFGESEGKEGKGLFPAAVDFTTDLHSMGQYIQEGERHISETVVRFGSVSTDITLDAEAVDHDDLNYIAGMTLHDVNDAAIDGTIAAHADGDVPQIVITVDEKSAYTMGQMIYFFELACAMSAYALGVNPFNQPGVEKYKSNMFALLGKTQ